MYIQIYIHMKIYICIHINICVFTVYTDNQNSSMSLSFDPTLTSRFMHSTTTHNCNTLL